MRGRQREQVFIRCLEGLFDAIHLPEVQDKAESTLRDVSRYVFSAEISRSKDASSRRYPSPLLASYLDALPHGLARENLQESSRATELVGSLVQELAAMVSSQQVAPQDVIPTLHQIASCFNSLCLDVTWTRNRAGCGGIRILTETPELGVKWISDRQHELVRTLIHVLKDMPYDTPFGLEYVTEVLMCVLRVSNVDLQSPGESGAIARNTLGQMMGIFFTELVSSNAVVRTVTQKCIATLAQLSGKPVVEMLMPHRDRMLSLIYQKPLRALPFPIQIGLVEALRYCLSLDPPLPELNDELLRLLHETLALADADDSALLGRASPRQGTLDIIKLRVACIKLLTASMPLTDFFARHSQTRQR